MLAISSKELIKNILSLPNAPIVLEEIKKELEEEKKKESSFIMILQNMRRLNS